MNFSLPPIAVKDMFYVSLIILIAVIINSTLRSLIKVPKTFDNRRSRTYITILRNIITVIVYGIALNVIFVVLGINITPLLASASIIGIAIGIGARPIIEDLVAGVFLLSQESIAIGDYIKIDEAEGTLETIGFRTLTIRTETGAVFIIPNGMAKKVINYSRNKAQVIIDIPVKIDEKIEPVLKSSNNALIALQKDKEIASALYPGSKIAGIEDFKATGPMLIRVTITTYPSRRFEVGRKYRYLVKKEFEKHKLSFG